MTFYFIASAQHKIPIFIHRYRELRASVWIILLTIIMAFLSYYGTFGGIKVMSTGLDIGIAILVAVGVFFLAYVTKLPNEIVQNYLDQARDADEFSG